MNVLDLPTALFFSDISHNSRRVTSSGISSFSSASVRRKSSSSASSSSCSCSYYLNLEFSIQAASP